MNTLQLSDICLSFGDRDLLRDVSFTMNSTTRAAMAGGNGEGKSTLLKIACRQITSDSGTISMTRDLDLCYLPQSDIVLGENTVYEEIEKAFDKYKRLMDQKTKLETQLEKTPESKSLLNEIHELQERLDNCDYYLRSTTISVIAKGLGFKESDMSRKCSEFSGGYQMRIALSRTLASNPDILLLDEPTNYLDIDARIWLKNFISQFSGGVMLVCHDRFFLDETVNEVYELCNSRLTRYKGNYTAYEKQRQEDIERLEAAYLKQQAEIQHKEAFIEKFRYKATKSRQVQSRIKMLEKLEPVFVPTHLKKLSFTFPAPPHSPNDMVIIEGLHKNFGDHVIYDDFNLIVNKGERLAVTGQNGTGKSTLLRMIAQVDSQYQGTLRLGPGVTIGYFAQDNETYLTPTNTIEEEIAQCATTSQLPTLRNILGNFLFSGDDIFKKVSVLSGGERSRLALLKILLKPASLLILDEPTNHLDINSQDMLLDAIRRYEGTLIFVSHDASFISKLATKILYLSDEQPELFAGNYEYFQWKLEQKEAYHKERKASSFQDEATTATQLPDYKEANRLRNQRQKLQNEAKTLLEEAERINSQINELDQLIALPENYSNSAKISKLVDSKASLEETKARKEDRWLEITEELESQKNEEIR